MINYGYQIITLCKIDEFDLYLIPAYQPITIGKIKAD